MTLQEIHSELHKDFSNTVGTLDNRLRKFGSVVLKSSRYPIRRHYECKSIEKRNRFWVMLTAIKRGEWNDPVIDYYCVFDRPEGLFCAFLDPPGRQFLRLPSAFLQQVQGACPRRQRDVRPGPDQVLREQDLDMVVHASLR